MADPPGSSGDCSSSESRRRPAHKRAAAVEPEMAAAAAAPPVAPCGACKFLRRKCVSGCIFAPHFGSDQGSTRFAVVHKIFGASNVSKLLLHIPISRRHDAVVTISYEAQARLADPVYGCVSTILALQQQVASLQAELAMVQSQLMNSRYAAANALHHHGPESQQPLPLLQSHHQSMSIPVIQQPAYSNNSSASTTNLINGIDSSSFSNPNNFSGNNIVVRVNDDPNHNGDNINNAASSSCHLWTSSHGPRNKDEEGEEPRNGLATVEMLIGRT